MEGDRSKDVPAYPIGSRVKFVDANATVRHGEPGVCEGTVNGPPISSLGMSGDTYLPVFTERDGGREPTTIYVHLSNVLGVEDVNADG